MWWSAVTAASAALLAVSGFAELAPALSVYFQIMAFPLAALSAILLLLATLRRGRRR